MGIFSDLSVSENMLLAARAASTVDDLDAKRLEWLFGLFPALKKFWLYPAGKLSGGQKQMLAIARAMVEPRRLLLIDEPSKGLAPAIVQNLIAALRELKRTETTILLVEQNFAMAKALGDRVAVMDDGRVVHRGPMASWPRTRGCSTACSASRWPRTNERRPLRRMTTLATPRAAAEAIPKSRFDARRSR
jgi:branched-chain amino acid transport system ATP-binding protein